MQHGIGERIPSLDGLRALSILMVLYGHLAGTQHFPVSIDDYGSWCGDVAHLGVLVFFVISGFLITSLLISEREQTGTMSMQRFYLRRILRIFPAFYAFILAMAVAVMLGWIQLSARDFVHAATFTVNIEPHRGFHVGHLWSLSVEEQFYVLWPLALMCLRKRRALIVAVAAICIAPLVRVAIREWAFRIDPRTFDGMQTSFPAMFDYLAAGCALALLRPWLLTRSWYLRLTASPWLLLAVPVTLLINRMGSQTLAIMLGSPLLNVCIALLIESSTRHADSLPGRWLNWPPLMWLGVLSYSLYLWQSPFLDHRSHAWINAFPQNLAFALLAAISSHALIERPFNRMRQRLQRGGRLPTQASAISSAGYVRPR